MTTLTRADAITRYGPPDAMGHITRFSDSSLYDEVCVMCGLTDGSIMLPANQPTIWNTPCPQAEKETS